MIKLVKFRDISVGTTFIPYYKDLNEYKRSHLGKCRKINEKDAVNINPMDHFPAGILIAIYHDSMVEECEA